MYIFIIYNMYILKYWTNRLLEKKWQIIHYINKLYIYIYIKYMKYLYDNI